jgi:hypothetical protein
MLAELYDLRYSLNDQLNNIADQNRVNPSMRTTTRKIISMIIIARMRTIQAEIEKLESENAFIQLEALSYLEEPRQ